VQVDYEKTQKNQGRLDQLQLMAAKLAQWWRLVKSNKALNLLYQAMRGIVPVHRRGHQNGQSFRYIFSLLFHLLLPWRLLGQYRASSHPMAASSGFQSSPGHAASGNAICIAPAHCCGHQNSQRMRCICLSLLPCLYHNTQL
jgi:hypothetical protein